MRALNYILRILNVHRGFIAFSLLLISSMQILILFLAIEIKIFTVAEYLIEQMPDMIRNMMAPEFIARMSIDGAASFGYNHPLVIAMCSILGIIFPGRHIARELDDGNLEVLLSLPIGRGRLFLYLLATTICAGILFVSAGLAGTWAGHRIFPEAAELRFLEFTYIGVNLLCLIICISSYTFLLAAFGKEGSKTVMRAGALTLFFYFFHYVSGFWSALTDFQIISVFYYYRPLGLLTGEVVWQNCAVLIGISFACLTVAFLRFRQRDIP